MKLPFKIDLKDKVAVITGAGGVLMREMAIALFECGAKVALLDINESAVSQLEKELGKNAYGIKTNCLEKDSLILARDLILKKWNKVDILINGAGGNSPKATCDNEYMQKNCDNGNKTFFDLDEQGLKFVFDLNIMSAFLTTQVFAECMLKDGGDIINISSMNAFKPLTKIPAYSAAKAGISNFTQWLAVHFAPSNIRANAIAPGFFVTNQNKSLLFNEEGKPTKRTEKILSHTPQNKFGEPKDLIGTLLWLCDRESSGFITGIFIPVDGGFSAYSGV